MPEIIMLSVYMTGFLSTLITLHKTNGFWGSWNLYDPPHDSYYDDYSSNSQAYLSFSIIWPLFIAGNLLALIWIGLERFSKYIGSKTSK